MITLFLLLLAVCLIGIIVLCVAGLLAVAWPLAIIFTVGILIDSLMIKKILGSKKK